MLAGAVQNYSLGGLREVPGGQKIALGGVRGRPGGGQEAPKSDSGGEKAPKSVQEPSWSHLGSKNGKTKEVEVSHLGGLGRPLGRLWGVSVALFGVILLRIAFLSLFCRFLDVFGMVFGTKNRRKNGEKTKLILKCFFDVFCDALLSSPVQRVL